MTVPLLPVDGRPGVPAPFADGLAAIDALLEAVPERPVRQGVALRTVPAPKRLAPWAVALAADVERDGEDVATGRFVVLHDREPQEGWQGDTRVIVLVEAQVEPEMATDPALGEVGWSWLLEALEGRGALHRAAGGTVTRTVSTRFGELAPGAELEPGDDLSQVELRASWTAAPRDGHLDLDRHLLAWVDLLCSTVGLPPEGTSALRPR